MILNHVEQCGYLTRLSKLTKESSCVRFFYAVVISTEFFSYLVRNQKDIKKSKVYLQELRPTNKKVRFCLTCICGLLRN